MDENGGVENGEQGRGWLSFFLWAVVWLIGCAIIIPAAYKVHWALAFFLALVAPLLLIFLAPTKGRRLVALVYIFFVAALVTGALAWNWLSSNAPPASAVLEEHAALRYVAGSRTKMLVSSVLAGLLGGLLLVGVPLLLALWISAEGVLALNELPDLSRKEALRLVANAALGLGPAWLVVDKGEEKESKPKGVLRKYSGPGIVVVREGNAVVFQRGGRITKIAGPGVARTKFLERIRCILDLTPQWETRVLENVRTRDQIPLTIELGVGYHIETKEETDKRLNNREVGEAATPVLGGVYQVYEGVVRNAAFKPAGDWKLTAFGMVESTLRDLVATYDFDQIFRHDPGGGVPGGFPPNQRAVRAIEVQVLGTVRPTAARMGIYITAVDIKAVEVPEEVQERLLEWWSARWQAAVRTALADAEKQALAAKGEGQAAALKAVEREKQEAMRQTLRTLEALVKETAWREPALAQRLVTAMQYLMGRVVVEDVIALRMLEALEKFSEGEGDLTVFLGGQGMPFIGPPGGQDKDSE